MNEFKESIRKISRGDIKSQINESYREEIMRANMLLSWIAEEDAIPKARRIIERLKSRLKRDQISFRGMDVLDSDIPEKIADLEKVLSENEKWEERRTNSRLDTSEREEKWFLS